MHVLLSAGLLVAAISARRTSVPRVGLFEVLKALVQGHADRALERERHRTLQAILHRPHLGDEVIECGGGRVVRPREPQRVDRAGHR